MDAENGETPQDPAQSPVQDPARDPAVELSCGTAGCACPCGTAAADAPEAGEEELVDVVGCRSRRSGPVDFFRVEGLELTVGDRVMVETEAGIVLAEVLMTRRMPPSRVPVGEFGPLAPVRGKANPSDILKAKDNERLSSEAKSHCQECIRSRKLDMKLVDVEVAHDRSKMAFYFTAPARIDFRELVKDLVRKYRTRIELRQIGVRHETQMVGAIGNCGMVCCCRRYLRKVAPVAIKMAKEQNVFLNPAKISGICGRLLCCLAYEQENYDAFYKRCPKLGKKYQTSRGVVRVLRASMFRESVSVLTESGEEQEFSLEEWQTLEPRRPEGGVPPQQSQGAPRPERNGGRGPRRDRPERENGAAPAEGQGREGGRQRGRPDSRQDSRADQRTDQRPLRRPEDERGPAPDTEFSQDTPGGRRRERPGAGHPGRGGTPRPERQAEAPLAPPDDVVDLPIDDVEDSSIFGLAPRRSGPEQGRNGKDGGSSSGPNSEND